MSTEDLHASRSPGTGASMLCIPSAVFSRPVLSMTEGLSFFLSSKLIVRSCITFNSCVFPSLSLALRSKALPFVAYSESSAYFYSFFSESTGGSQDAKSFTSYPWHLCFSARSDSYIYESSVMTVSFSIGAVICASFFPWSGLISYEA